MQASSRVALNTFILYGRMILTMGISLYSTRIVLKALGDLDYGIFNLIAGTIVMLSFLNAAMSTASQRYLSFHQGKKDYNKQKQVFTNSLFLHIFLGILIVILLEIAGLFLFDGFLNIPESRVHSAKIIYHYMAVTVFFTVIAVPFTGLLIAHENIWWVAIVNIVETFLKLAIAVSLFYIEFDKLITYGVLSASITIITFFLYAVFSFKRYSECTFENLFKPEKNSIRELTSFAGWNLIGALCGMGRNQGLALILNLFFGAVINAAYGIASQVGAQLLFFSRTMLSALNPQIMKSEGSGDRERMLRLSMMASKFGLFLLAIFAIPIIFEMTSILRFWLNDIPDHTIIFCRLVLIGSLTNQLTIGIQSAMQAYGDIKYYQIIVGGMLLFNLPLAYTILKFSDFPPYSVLVSYVFIEFCACVLRLIFAKYKLKLSIKKYFENVIFKEIIALGIIILFNILVVECIEMPYKVGFTLIVSFLISLPTIYVFGLNSAERLMLNGIINKLRLKIFKS